MLASLAGVRGDVEHRRRVYPLEGLLHVLGGGNALVIVYKDYIDRSPKSHKVIYAPGADREDDDDQQAITECEFSSQAVHACVLQELRDQITRVSITALC